MKHLLHILLLSFSVYINGQDTNWLDENLSITIPCNPGCIDSLLKYDFSSLWTNTDESSIYGFIGDNYQRIRIKIISVNKDNENPVVYNVIGKSMVKTNISQFTGVIKISQIKIYKTMHWGVDNEYKDKGIKNQGVIIAEYQFAEDSAQTHSGVFKGKLSTWWYIDKIGKIQYDNIQISSDPYSNNQFVGTWTSFQIKATKPCNWGDSRIPNSGDLDIGAGEFSPDDKYLPYGWQTYRDAYINNDKQALQIEQKKWWK